jgi:hypothetical protein
MQQAKGIHAERALAPAACTQHGTKWIIRGFNNNPEGDDICRALGF